MYTAATQANRERETERKSQGQSHRISLSLSLNQEKPLSLSTFATRRLPEENYVIRSSVRGTDSSRLHGSEARRHRSSRARDYTRTKTLVNKKRACTRERARALLALLLVGCRCSPRRALDENRVRALPSVPSLSLSLSLLHTLTHTYTYHTHTQAGGRTEKASGAGARGRAEPGRRHRLASGIIC